MHRRRHGMGSLNASLMGWLTVAPIRRVRTDLRWEGARRRVGRKGCTKEEAAMRSRMGDRKHGTGSWNTISMGWYMVFTTHVWTCLNRNAQGREDQQKLGRGR